jgi:hypothetical protein
MSTVTEIRTETLADVIARQSIVPEYLQTMLEEHGADATVDTLTRVTPFGNYLTSVRITGSAS